MSKPSTNTMTSNDHTTKLSKSTSRTPSGVSTVSRKRKISPQIKFYAVRLGHTPGVYLNWKECEQNITGFPGASFKSFPTLDEAEAYVAGREPIIKSTTSSGIEKFYGVAKGRIPGVYTNWTEAQEQIKGWKGPKYKKFTTRDEAEAFVRNGNSTSLGLRAGGKEMSHDVAILDANVSQDEIGIDRGRKRSRIMLSSSETPIDNAAVQDSLRHGNEIGETNRREVTGKCQIGELRIYTDGSSLGNGKNGARAGLGVYFGSGDPRNVAERLPGPLQTNQRAELAAILRALEISPTNRDVHIVTDSEYSIKCLTLWYKSWERNQWLTSTKKPVLNKDLIKRALAKVKDREALGTATRFSWIKDHSKDPGNEAADRLAVLGAQKPYLN